jgi:DNA primase
MANPGDFAYTVKQQADIVRIIGDYVKLKKAGAQNYSGLCPFHGEKTASFSVHATRQFYHCFGCGLSGDVFSFVQKIENITFPEAVRLVAQKLGIAIPQATYNTPAEAKEAKLRGVLLDVHERACTFFQELLRRPEGATARDYLTGRGLTEEIIKTFRIGYAPDSGFLLRDRLKNEFAEEVLRESGLFSWKQGAGSKEGPYKEGAPSLSLPPLERQGGDLVQSPAPKAKTTGPAPAAMYSKFRNRVMFPIANESGKVIAFTGRTLSTDEKAGPKYLNSPETAIYSKSKVLFNLDHAKEAIRKLDYAILVEGQMDCISVYSAGFQNVIASSGTAFTELQAKFLGRFSKNIVVNFDPDTAGAKATERTLGLLVEEEFNIKVLTLEAGFDPDLFLRRQGKDAYAAALKNSQRYFNYLIERARAQFPARNAESKVKAVNFLLPHVQRIPNRIVRDEIAQEIAQKLSIDSAVLRQELKQAVTNRSASSLKAPTEAQVTDAEKILIRALASANEMSNNNDEHISARDGAEEPFDPARQARFAMRGDNLHTGMPAESLLSALLSAPEDANPMDLPLSASDRNLLAQTLMHDEEELTPERLEGAIRGVRRIHLRRRIEQIQRELANRGLTAASMQALLQEKVRLKRALMDPALSAPNTMENNSGPSAA